MSAESGAVTRSLGGSQQGPVKYCLPLRFTVLPIYNCDDRGVLSKNLEHDRTTVPSVGLDQPRQQLGALSG